MDRFEIFKNTLKDKYNTMIFRLESGDKPITYYFDDIRIASPNRVYRYNKSGFSNLGGNLYLLEGVRVEDEITDVVIDGQKIIYAEGCVKK
ncbi:hypothetical protein SAMN05216390_1147 [Lachnospiraceae bacterium KH1T2]|nr:hypothetical protein SAMN05216390_1147 [Lachnospiraceae bacterium KH1T2]